MGKYRGSQKLIENMFDDDGVFDTSESEAFMLGKEKKKTRYLTNKNKKKKSKKDYEDDYYN